MLLVSQLKVPQVPSYEEFYGLTDNIVSDEEFESDNKDEKIKELITIALSLLQDFYLEVQYYTEYDILSGNFERKLNDFNVELKESLLQLFNNYFDDLHVDESIHYAIPVGTVKSDYDIANVLKSSVDSVTDTLYSDLKNKADFYHDVAITTGMFSLHADFRRAIRKLSNKISGNAEYARNRVNRAFLEFVYGQEALFRWVVSGRNTCAWCYAIEAMGAMPLSWFPVDHPNGMCRLVPEKPDQYSDEYRRIRGWL